MARKGTAQYKGAPRGGQPRRKKGAWLVEHNSRAHRERDLLYRANVNWPKITDVGSAAYRRAANAKRGRR